MKEKAFTPIEEIAEVGEANKKNSLAIFIMGFTLIELLVVISVISLLSSVIFASLQDARAQARDAQRVSQAQEVQKALLVYKSDTGSYPSDMNTLVSGGYIADIPSDPGDNQYTYYGSGDVAVFESDLETTVAGNFCSSGLTLIYLAFDSGSHVINLNVTDNPFTDNLGNYVFVNKYTISLENDDKTIKKIVVGYSAGDLGPPSVGTITAVGGGLCETQKESGFSPVTIPGTLFPYADGYTASCESFMPVDLSIPALIDIAESGESNLCVGSKYCSCAFQ